MIEIGYDNGEKIIIRLFDSSISKKLVSCYSELFKDSYFIGDCSINSNITDFEGRFANKEEIDYHWSKIFEGLAGMKELGNEINIKFPKEFDFNQQTLNILHRIFTYTDLYESGEITEYPYSNNYTKDVGMSFEQYHSIVDKINVGVHNLEAWAKPTENKSYLNNNFPLARIQYCTKNYSTFQMKWCEFDSEEYKENFKFLSYDVDNIVTLRDTILGKSPLASFRDDDDPTLPDCTGRFATDGSFQINRGKELQNFYTSDYFKNWAEKYGETIYTLPLEFAIGYVDIERTTKDLNYFFNNDLNLKYLIWK